MKALLQKANPRLRDFGHGFEYSNKLGIKQLRKGVFMLIVLLISMGLQNANAQIAYTEGFNSASVPTGWVATGFSASNALTPCEGTHSIRGNRWSSSTTGSIVSPSIGTSNGGLISLGFEYKIIDFSSPNAATPANFGTIEVQYGATATGPWTTVQTINALNHLPSTSCATVNVPGFGVANGPTYLRYNTTWTAGDYYIYFDNIIVSQGAAPACPQPSALTASSITSSGASLGWTENGSATAWEIEYGLLGFTPGTGTTVTSGSNPYSLAGLPGANTTYSYYVRANCGGNGYSLWSGPYSFTTLCGSQLSGAVTVNPSVPASATNFTSFTSLSSELNACGISGPVTVTVAPNSGPYNERFILNGIVGSSSTNTVTINGNGNLLTFNAPASADRATVLFNGTDYVTINNLKIEGQSTAQAHAVHLYNEANYNTFNGCEFIVSQSVTTTFVSGVVLSASLTSAVTAGNTGNYNTFSNNIFTGGYYGITLMGTSTTVACQQNKVLNNTFSNYYLYGIYLSNQEDAEITANDLSRATRSVLSTFYGVAFLGTNPGTLINRNKIHDNSNAGLTNTSAAYPIYASSGAGTAAKPMNIVNNAAYNINGFGIKYGIYLLTNSFYLNIYHNTIDLSNPSQTGTSVIAGIYHTGLATGVDLKNNIFVLNNGSTGLKRVLWFSNTAPAFTSNYNDLINLSAPGATTVIATRGTTNFTTLADWQLAAANIYDQNSVSLNPVFANPSAGNIAPLNGALNNLGTPLGVTTDINGVARNAITPDMGAAEFTGVTNDIALVSGQLKRELCYSTNDSVLLTISNFIGGTVNFATTPLTATWNVTGPTNSNGTITINTGTLASGASMVIKGNGVAMPSGGTYVLNAYISANTANLSASNDSLLPVSFTVNKLLAVIPTMTTITNSVDSVELQAFSGFFPSAGFKFTEVSQFKGAISGIWPAYMISDDYIEITGAPFSDMGGITLETWTTTALTTSYTFPSGTILGPNGTAIIAIGEMGASAPSPSNYYYHGNGTFTSSYGSGTGQGRILKDGLGNIMDAFGYSGSTTVAYVFPAAANVSAADWSASPLGGSGTAGWRLDGADVNSGTNWVLTAGANPQTPNVVNTGVTVPSAPPVPGFSWMLNGTVIDTSLSTYVGPWMYADNGTYKFVARYNSASCGFVYDTATVVVNLPCPVYPTPFVEGFEATSTTLSCWSQAYVTGTKNWTVATGAGGGTVLTAKSGTSNMRFTSSGSGPHITRLISPMMDASTLTASELRFSYAQEVWAGDQNFLNVYYRDSANGAWNIVWSDSTNKAAWTNVIQAIPSTSATLQLAFEGVDNYGRAVVLDDVSITNPPACPQSTQFTVISATANSVTLTWNASSTSSSFILEYDSAGFVLGTGMNMVSTNDTATITGLTANTMYDVYLIDSCGIAGISLATGPLSFTTSCAVVPLVYTETFETSSTTFSCWTSQGSWALSPVGGFGTSAASFRFPFYSVSSGTFSATSPEFTPTAAGDELSFDHAYATYINEIDQVQIEYSTDAGATYTSLVLLTGGTNGTMTTAPATTSSFTPTASQWANYSITLPTGTNRIRFKAISAYGNNFYADNISVGPAPLAPFTLISPPSGTTLLVAGSAQSQVVASWHQSSPTASYQWRAFLPAGSVNNPLVALPSNSAGSDTTITFTMGQLDALLASLAVNIGDTVTVNWNVKAMQGTDSVFGTSPFSLTLVRLGLSAPLYVTAPQYVVSPGSTGISGPSATAAAKYFRAAQVVLPTEYAAANVSNGDAIRSVGFVLNAPASGAVTGIMKVYLQNSSDLTYLKNTTWSDIITGMTLLHSDTVVIPAGATTYNMSANQNFVYTGGSMYLAYEFEQISAPLTTGLVYRANTALPASIRRGQSATAFPAAVTGSSAFRLEVLWGVDREANDLETVTLWARGSNALTYGTPETVSVVVRNNGYLPANKMVTFTASGANTATATASVSLLEGQSDTVSFVFTPTNLGFTTLTASVPADSVNGNNAKSWVQNVNATTMGYADTTSAGLGGVGFNTGSGILVSRFAVNGQRAVDSVRVRIANNAASVGQTVYAVVLDSAGAIVAQSANVVLTAADINGWKSFTISNPPTFTNEDFYVGLAQTVGSVGYFPIAFQTEQLVRPNAFYGADLTGANLGSSNFRFLIEAVLGAVAACPQPTAVAVAETCDGGTVTWTSSAGALGSSVQFGPTGFTPGTGTIASATGGTYTISGLANGTTYDVWVKDSCTSNTSAYTGPFTFTTEDVADVTAGYNVVNVTATFATVDFTSTINNGATVTSYSWDYGDLTPAGSGSAPSHDYQMNGTYTAVVTTTNTCGMSYDTISVLVEGIRIDEFGFGNIALYPNPNDGFFSISGLSAFGSSATLDVLNTTGTIVYQQTIVANGSESFKIDLRGLPAGVYQVRVSSEHGVGVKPFVIRQ